MRRMQDQSVSFAVVVPTYSRPQRLASCLAALARQTLPPERFEVIVVDDGSPQSVRGAVEPFKNQMRLSLVRQPNSGPAAARNAGAARANGTHLAFTDDDCEPDPNWLRTLSEHLQRNPAALVGGRIVNCLAQDPYARASQAITDFVSERSAAQEGFKLFATCNLAVSAAGFRQLGGYCTGFSLAAGEDYDFCHRWQHAGRQVLYAPDAIVGHRHALSLGSFCRQHFNYGRGLMQFHARAAAREGHARIKSQRTSFYLGLLRYPLRDGISVRGVRESGLVLISQIATAAGAACEACRRIESSETQEGEMIA